MTNEELERAIDFILKSQARAETRIERNEEQLRQLTEQVSSFADTQANIMLVMTRTFEAQAKINEAVQENLRALTDSLARMENKQSEMADRQSRMEDALVRMAEAQASSERRLETLIKIVEEGRRGDG
jgi:chromosome segregation ATPase